MENGKKFIWQSFCVLWDGVGINVVIGGVFSVVVEPVYIVYEKVEIRA